MKKERAEQLLKDITEYYNLKAGEFSRTRKDPWPEAKFLFDIINPGDSVLDLGCGNGRFFRFFNEKKADYIGADFSSELIEIAKKENPEGRFKKADALDVPFQENQFDKVYSIAVLHHIPSKGLRMTFLKETRRVLKPGGIFVLTCWKLPLKRTLSLNLKSLVMKIFGKKDMDKGDALVPWGKKAERYYHIFSKKELENLVETSGFEIQKSGVFKNKVGNRQNFYIIAKK